MYKVVLSMTVLITLFSSASVNADSIVNNKSNEVTQLQTRTLERAIASGLDDVEER
ncbi:MAG: hypothetical protein HWE27_17885 [Gammaproteobacteria bacterium]|nr:hypothetical protein [Gammaproteobacteria bacterium]